MKSEVSSADAVGDVLNELLVFMSTPGSVHLFRGQGIAAWPTMPTLYRRLINAGYGYSNITEEFVSAHETDLLCEAHGAGFYLGSRLDTMVKLQHFGGSTRLLDVTRDPFVALWFAVGQEHDGEDGSVLCYSADPAVVAEAGTISNWDALSSDIPPGKALVYFPVREEERVKAQRAGFISAALEGSLAEGSAYTGGTDRIETHLVRIPGELKAAIRDYLITSRGFSAYSLFPDFEGFAMGHGANRAFPRAVDALYGDEDGIFPRKFSYPFSRARESFI